MDRKIIFTGVFLTGLLMAMPAQAQAQAQEQAQEHVWTNDRPDGHGPAGMKSDYVLPWGVFYIGGRIFSEQYVGTLIGSNEISSVEVLDFFTTAPRELDRSVAEVDVRFGLLPFLTLAGSIPVMRNEMLSETNTVFFQSASEVIGDISIRGLFRVLEMEEYRVSLTGGVTLPFGKLGKTGQTAVSPNAVLPFAMQGGSGSYDLLVGGTFQAQNARSSVGFQFNGVIRWMDNNRDYRLGDRIDLSFWGAYNISDWVSVSMRGFYEHWGDVSGNEVRTDGLADPGANEFAQGGERVTIPMGLNIYFRDGAMDGHRLSLEYYYPVHENLNGPQLSIQSGFVLSWQLSF